MGTDRVFTLLIDGVNEGVAHLEADLILGLLGVLLDGVGGGHGGGVDVGVVGDDEPAAGEGYKVLVTIFTI